ncbi:MAG: hypothetical protein H5T98_09460 [Syntrophomonadaceae bacterium]|nr:hypothetical protein [Syntrophomonadaceae bacterium]
MNLAIVAPQFIDKAWNDGASCLEEACATVDEITGSQLKLLLSRGERTLVALMDNDKPVGWGCWRVDQLPNVRVLHCTDLVAHNAHFELFFDELKKAAEYLGCSEIRYCPGSDSRARLFAAKLKAEPVYTTYRVKL